MTFGHAFVATLRTIFSDASARSTLVAAIVMYSFFYPAAYQHQVADRMPVVAVDLDHSALSRQLLRNVSAIQAVRVVDSVDSMREARTALEHMEADGILLIAADLQRKVRRGEIGEVAIYSNGASSVRNRTVLAGLNAALAATTVTTIVSQGLSQPTSALPPVTYVQRPLFNTREGYGSYVVPGVAELILQQTLLAGVVLLAGTRRERGQGRTTAPAFLGIASAFIAIGCVNALYYFGFMFWFQDYPRGGNFAGMLLATLLYISAVVAFALCIGSFFAVRERALQVLLTTSLPMFFLAGLSWPIEAIPVPLRWLGDFIPLTHGISAMLKLNQFGARIDEVGSDLVRLCLLIVLYGGIAAARYVDWATLFSSDGPFPSLRRD
jgi:ABC-2 type transport system permease protein